MKRILNSCHDSQVGIAKMGDCVVWKVHPFFVLLGRIYFLSLCLLGYHLFLRGRGFVELCTITQNPKVSTHSCIDISKTTIVWNPKWKVVNCPACANYLDYITNFKVSINVVNGWAWAKVTHQFWPLGRSYLILESPRHNGYCFS